MTLRPFRATVFVGLVVLSAALASADETPEGWIDLFATAGPDSQLGGWTRLTIPPGGKVDPKSQWSFDPATKILTCNGDGGHEWLRFDKPFSDFIYHVEWRFVPVTSGKKGYNSGIYVRNSADATIWHQGQTGNGPAGFLFGETMVKGQKKRLNFQKDDQAKNVKPAGEWNTFEVSCRGKEVVLTTNGKEANRWADCEVPSGHVGLEAEGYRVEFRNVRLKPH